MIRVFSDKQPPLQKIHKKFCDIDIVFTKLLQKTQPDFEDSADFPLYVYLLIDANAKYERDM